MPRPRINGAMFPDFQSKSVTVLGIATEVLVAHILLLVLGVLGVLLINAPALSAYRRYRPPR